MIQSWSLDRDWFYIKSRWSWVHTGQTLEGGQTKPLWKVCNHKEDLSGWWKQFISYLKTAPGFLKHCIFIPCIYA